MVFQLTCLIQMGEKIPESAQLRFIRRKTKKTPIEQLEDALLLDFKGQTKSVEEIYLCII